MSVDLVVVNYRTDDDLNNFIESLGRYEPTVDLTVTVVNVGAEDDERHGMADMQILDTTENIGYGRACNLGASLGTNDVIALFNADVMLTPHAIDDCYHALMEHEDWGVLGPRQVDLYGQVRHAGIFGTLDRPLHRGWNERDRAQYVDVRDAVTVAGSVYFVKRKVWQELTDCELYREIAPDVLGAFLPTPHYYDDTWCSYHAQAHGYKVVYYGKTTVIHKWHQASPVGGWAEQQVPASQAYFRAACEHHGIPHD